MSTIILNNDIDKEIFIYPGDVDKSIKHRIAAAMHTTPMFLFIKSTNEANEEIPRSGNIEVTDVFHDLIITPNKPVIDKVKNEYINWIEQSSNQYNRMYREKILINAVIYHSLEDMSIPAIMEFNKSYCLTENIINNAVEFIRTLRSMHDINIQDNDRLNTELTTRLKEGTIYGTPSPTIQETQKLTVRLALDSEIRVIPLPVMFDSIMAVEKGAVGVQFARIGKLIKFHQTNHPPPGALVVLPDEETSDLEDCVLTVGITLPNDFSVGRLTTFRLSYKYPENKSVDTNDVYLEAVYINRSEPDKNAISLLKEYIPALHNRLSGYEIIESLVVATFTIPNYTFESEYLSCYIFMSVKFSKEFIIDELHNGHIGRLYLYHVRSKIRISIAVEKFPSAKEETLFTRVRIYNGESLEVINSIKEDIVDMLFEYKVDERYRQQIVDSYVPDEWKVDEYEPKVRPLKDSIHIRTNPQQKKVRAVDENDLQSLLFTASYSKKCKQERYPTLVDEKPNSCPSTWGVFPYEGSKIAKYAVCRQKDYPYYGLIRGNNLSNWEMFESIPCCYATPQKNTQLDQDRSVQDVYSTSRIVPVNSYGYLPSGPSMFFSILGKREEDKDKFCFLDAIRSKVKDKSTSNCLSFRYGTERGPNSFIEAVLRAQHIQKYFNNYNPNDSPYELKSFELHLERANLKKYLNLCSQEIWDLDRASVEKWFDDPNEYFEPHRFVRALEFAYKCNIYIFEKNAKRVTGFDENGKIILSRVRNTPNGAMIVPPHCPDGLYFHGKQKNIEPHMNVFVIVHHGNDMGNYGKYPYPHVECILTDNPRKASELAYNLFNRMSLSTSEVTDEVVKWYDSLNKLNLNDDVQTLDKAGRCVQINDEPLLNSETGNLEPMSPFPIKIKQVARIDNKSVSDPRDCLEGRRILQRISRVYLNLLIHIRANLTEVQDISFVFDPSRFTWGTEDTAGSVIKAFMKPQWEVRAIKNVALENNRLVLDSEDTMRRLQYLSDIVLNRMTQNEMKKIRENTYLSGYFNTIDDFTQRPGQFITSTKLLSAIKPLVQEVVLMYDKPQPVRDGQYVVFKTNTFEIRLKAVFTTEVLKKLITAWNVGNQIEIKVHIWDGIWFRETQIKGTVPFERIFVYKLGYRTVFLVSTDNKNSIADKIIRDF